MVSSCSSCPGGCDDIGKTFDGDLSTAMNPDGEGMALSLVYQFAAPDTIIQKVVVYVGDSVHDRSLWSFAVSSSATSGFAPVASFRATLGVSPKEMPFAPLSATSGLYIQVMTDTGSWQLYLHEILFYGLTCPAGFYVNASGGATDACLPCLAGTYSTADGQALASVCQPCPAGSYGTAMAGSSVASACDGTCSGGSYSVGGASACTQCLAGTYSTGSGSSACLVCSAGKYSRVGGTSCRSCAYGPYFSPGG